MSTPKNMDCIMKDMWISLKAVVLFFALFMSTSIAQQELELSDERYETIVSDFETPTEGNLAQAGIDQSGTVVNQAQ